MKYTHVLSVGLVTSLMLGTMTSIQAATKLGSDLALKGDLRLRHQIEKKDSGIQRNRNRIRFRLAGQKKLATQTHVMFGLATGGTDQRSTNQTLENASQTPDIRLDYAYVKHQLAQKWTLLAGKMKNPLWRPSDLLWDSDINPDGFSVQYHIKKRNQKWFMNSGYIILDESKEDASDPSLIAIQQGLVMTHSAKATTSIGIALYVSSHYANVSGNASAETNSDQEDFAVATLSAQLNLLDLFGCARVRPFGEVVVNTNKDTDNEGFIAGVKFGAKKVKKRGAWQTTISYRYLEKDAWFDSFPDSDAYGGATNTEGLEVAISYGLSRSTKLGIDYYVMDTIQGESDKQSVLQLDVSFKF